MDHLKSDLQKVRISNGQILDPTVDTSKTIYITCFDRNRACSKFTLACKATIVGLWLFMFATLRCTWSGSKIDWKFDQVLTKSFFSSSRGQCSSLVAHAMWTTLQFPVGKINFPHSFLVAISWLPFTFKLLHDKVRWWIHELIHHIWLAVTLNDIIAVHKTNLQKAITGCLKLHFIESWVHTFA